jgi:hypothetical protein
VCQWLYCILAYIPLGTYPGVVLLGCMVGLFLLFWGVYILISVMVCNNLHFHKKFVRVTFSMHLHQHLLLFVLLIITILTRMKWNLNIISICISFMTKDIGHFFIYLLTIYISFENLLFNSFAHLFSGLPIIWGVSFF